MKDRGSVTIWVLGLCVALLFLGGLSIDLWRGFTERRQLAGMADGAVVAGATALDVDTWRSSGVAQLDAGLAGDRASAYLLAHPEWDAAITPTITSAAAGIQVVLEQEVEFTLLRVLLPDEEPFTVRVTANAIPALSP
jgi:hypothetical protein